MVLHQVSASQGSLTQPGTEVHWHIPNHQGPESGGGALKLPPTLGQVHPVFHVSRVKPVLYSPLVSSAPALSPPPSSGLLHGLYHVEVARCQT